MEYQCRRATSQEELELARNIVLAEYIRSGYITEASVRSGEPNILPSDTSVGSPQSITLIVPHAGKVVGTVSVILDSPTGFPMDSLYHAELDQLRQEGKRLAEIVQLATDQDFVADLSRIGGKLSLLISLFRGVLRVGKEHTLDGFCITVNPKHDQFYTEMGFSSLGEEKQYGALGGAPTLAKILYWQDQMQRLDEKNSLFHLFRDAV